MPTEDQQRAPANRRLAEALARGLMNYRKHEVAVKAALGKKPFLGEEFELGYGGVQQMPDRTVHLAPYNSSPYWPDRSYDAQVPLVHPSPNNMVGALAPPVTPPSEIFSKRQPQLIDPTNPDLYVPDYQPRFIQPTYPEQYDPVLDEKDLSSDHEDPLGLQRRRQEQPFPPFPNQRTNINPAGQLDSLIVAALLRGTR